MRGLASLTPLALLLVACTSLPPTPTPTLTPGPTPPSAPSPSPTASPEPALRVNGLATIARDGLRLWLDPVRGDRGPRKKFLSLMAGAQVLLVDGPLQVDGIDYWQVYPSTRGYADPLGWVATTKADGTPNLSPFQPACPPAEGITTAQLGALDPLERLACFGNQELALHGVLTCNYGIGDGFLAGPMLSSNFFCVIDNAVGLKGPVAGGLDWDHNQQPVFTGNYQVRGHFDDPGAQHCYQTPFGTPLEGSRDPGDPGAIQECRGFFVVTAVQKLTN